MERKAFAAVEWKAETEGTFRAIFSTFGSVDNDGDVTLPGALPVGQEVLLGAYQHKSWDGMLPIGKGVIGADAEKGWLDGEYFLDTLGGRDTYTTVKRTGSLQEYSYSYDPLIASTKADELRKYPGARRILKKLGVDEVAPVFKGAGIGTGTAFLKSASTYAEDAEHVLADVQAFIERSKSLADLRVKEGRTLSQANRERIDSVMAAARTAMDDLEKLLTDTAPQPKGVLNVLASRARLRAELAQFSSELGIPLSI